MKLPFPLFPLVFLLPLSSVQAQSILIPHSSQNGGPNVAAFSALDGSLQTAALIDLTQDSAPINAPVQAVPSLGRYWVTDRVLEVAHVWAPEGTDYLADQLQGFGDLYGGVEGFGSTWFCQYAPGAGTGSLIEVKAGVVTQFPLSYSPLGILALGNELILTAGSSVERFDPVARVELGSLYSSPAQGGFHQPSIRGTTGNLLIPRGAGNNDVVEMDLSGTIVAEFNIGADLGIFAPQSCTELANGGILVSNASGVWLLDSGFQAPSQLLSGVQAVYASIVPNVALGASYCGPAVPNSTGRSARIGASGSASADVRAFRLAAHDLPNGQSGYFLASMTQGFVSTPPGSVGNLCLGGAIGRLSSQIQNSSTVGFFDIEVDTTQVPQPMGPASILSGQSWNWQAWYRDVVGGQSTSNFTDAVAVSFQ